MLTITAVLLGLLVLTGEAPSGRQQPARDRAERLTPGDGVISGRVTDKSTGRPIRGALVTLSPVPGVFGRRYLEFSNLPKGWYVKSAAYGAADITERAFEAKEDGAMLEILLSRRGASIAGSVLDGIGNPAAGAKVVVFAANPARRLLGGITLVAGGRDGRFTAGPLRAGDYLVVALPAGADSPTNDDVEYLERLAKDAERVTLHGEETIDLQLRVR